VARPARILNRPPERVAVAAYNLVDRTPTGSRAVLERLRGLLARELTSDLDDVSPTSPKDVPSPGTGELGFDDDYDRAHLTITLGLGASGFEALGIDPEDRPQDLIPIPWASLGDSPEISDQGDLVLHVCADNLYIVEHVSRRVEEEMSDGLTQVRPFRRAALLDARRTNEPARRASADRLPRRDDGTSPGSTNTSRASRSSLPGWRLPAASSLSPSLARSRPNSSSLSAPGCRTRTSRGRAPVATGSSPSITGS
jgi:hypothetical protein